MKTKHGFLRDRRGISPVLSNLLLTVVAVTVMALATTATYVITTNLRENMSERLVIEDVWFNDSTGNISVYLRNIGKVATHVSEVYLNHSLTSFTWPFRLEIGQHGWLNISYTHVPTSLYYVDIITTRGTHIGGFYKTT